jgi:hypothetical protein
MTKTKTLSVRKFILFGLGILLEILMALEDYDEKVEQDSAVLGES